MNRAVWLSTRPHAMPVTRACDYCRRPWLPNRFHPGSCDECGAPPPAPVVGVDLASGPDRVVTRYASAFGMVDIRPEAGVQDRDLTPTITDVERFAQDGWERGQTGPFELALSPTDYVHLMGAVRSSSPFQVWLAGL